MLKDFIPKSQDPLRTCNVMGYELGYIEHDLLYAELRKGWADEDSIKAKIKNARINLANLITICRLLAEQMSWDMGTLWKDGEERLYERMKEIEECRL